MKTSEMIAMLERNPKLEFRGKMWDDNDRRYFGVDAEGIMRFFPENSGVLYVGGEFWVEVTKQPESTISAGVAIKALQDGKTIHCMIGSERFTYEPGSVYYIPYTAIKDGKWFIKEDNFWMRKPCLRATEAEVEVERLKTELKKEQKWVEHWHYLLEKSEAENALLRKAVSAASMFCRDTSSPARLDKLRDALSELEQEGRNCKF